MNCRSSRIFEHFTHCSLRWHDGRRHLFSTRQLNLDLSKQHNRATIPALSVMPTPLLVRSIVVMTVLSSPWLVRLCLPIMNYMSTTTLSILNPDKNPILHSVTRKMFYDHFAAGENELEVRRNVSMIKTIGYQGAILGYAREILVENMPHVHDKSARNKILLEEWLDGNLRTLKMVATGDFLAVKLTGAGPAATEGLVCGIQPTGIENGLYSLCNTAKKQGTRIWIDAEQQYYQKSIDAWTINLMRRYNRDQTIVYNTFQAYLKSAPQNIARFLNLAAKEGWTIGIKLVRGAYIATEPKHLIHNSKAETDEAYDNIVKQLLMRSFPGVDVFPKVQLMVASHNSKTVTAALDTWNARQTAGEPTIKLEFAQLQGMADEIGCNLIQTTNSVHVGLGNSTPKAFKCMHWGTVQECLGYLSRRAAENTAALARTKEWRFNMWKECKRRYGLM